MHHHNRCIVLLPYQLNHLRKQQFATFNRSTSRISCRGKNDDCDKSVTLGEPNNLWNPNNWTARFCLNGFSPTKEWIGGKVDGKPAFCFLTKTIQAFFTVRATKSTMHTTSPRTHSTNFNKKMKFFVWPWAEFFPPPLVTFSSALKQSAFFRNRGLFLSVVQLTGTNVLRTRLSTRQKCLKSYCSAQNQVREYQIGLVLEF